MQELLEGLLRIVLAVIVEFLIKGPGYLIVKPFRRGEETEFDGCLVLFFGVLFWCLVAGGLWLVFG